MPVKYALILLLFSPTIMAGVFTGGSVFDGFDRDVKAFASGILLMIFIAQTTSFIKFLSLFKFKSRGNFKSRFFKSRRR